MADIKKIEGGSALPEKRKLEGDQEADKSESNKKQKVELEFTAQQEIDRLFAAYDKMVESKADENKDDALKARRFTAAEKGKAALIEMPEEEVHDEVNDEVDDEDSGSDDSDSDDSDSDFSDGLDTHSEDELY